MYLKQTGYEMWTGLI